MERDPPLYHFRSRDVILRLEVPRRKNSRQKVDGLEKYISAHEQSTQ